MNELEKRFRNTLRSHDVRVTHARLEIFETLREADEAISLSDIAKNTKNTDRASVYRTLILFEQLQLVSVVLVGWKKHFELSAPYKSHHHHIYCMHCGKVVSLHSASLEELIKTIATKKGFQLHTHTLELSGTCLDCQSAMQSSQ